MPDAEPRQVRDEWAAHTPSVVHTLQSSFTTTAAAPPPVRTTVLRDAEKAINGDREEKYGAPKENLTNVANLWSVLLGPKLKDGIDLTAGDVALLMCALKLARSLTTPKHLDHWVDAAGYAALAAEVSQ